MSPSLTSCTAPVSRRFAGSRRLPICTTSPLRPITLEDRFARWLRCIWRHAIPNFLVLEQMEHERALRDEICTEPVRFEDGCFVLPEGPGLGTDLVLDALQDRPFKPQPQRRSFESIWR